MVLRGSESHEESIHLASPSRLAQTAKSRSAYPAAVIWGRQKGSPGEGEKKIQLYITPYLISYFGRLSRLTKEGVRNRTTTDNSVSAYSLNYHKSLSNRIRDFGFLQSQAMKTVRAQHKHKGQDARSVPSCSWSLIPCPFFLAFRLTAVSIDFRWFSFLLAFHGRPPSSSFLIDQS